MPFWMSVAAASPLALLALDGRGIDATAASDATDALRDAMVADGRLDVMLASPIAEALAAGHESDLKKARERYAAGKKAYDAADSTSAIAALTEAIRLHDLAGSSWVRRAELADTRWLLALCMLRDGRVLDGRGQLVEVAKLWPGYAHTRGIGSAVATRMLDEVEEGMAKETWTPPEDPALDALFRELEPGWLALGAVDGAGGVIVYLVASSGDVEQVEGVVSLPIDMMDEAWTAIAAEIAENTGRTRDDSGSDTTAAADPESDDYAPNDEAPDDREEPKVAPPPETMSDGRVRIRERGTIRYDEGPVTHKWWFWTLLVATIGGTSAVAYVLSQPPTVIEVQDPDTYSVTVQTP